LDFYQIRIRLPNFRIHALSTLAWRRLIPFAVGNIIVKNPADGGMNIHRTYLNQIWRPGVPNTNRQSSSTLSSLT